MHNINLLPWREKKRETANKRRMLYLLASILSAGTVAFIIECYAIYLVNNQQYINQKLNQEIIRLEKKIKPSIKWDMSRQLFLKKIAIIDEMKNDVRISLYFFCHLIELIPSRISLVKIERNLDRITLFGCSDAAHYIPQLMRNVLKAKWIKSFEIPEIQQIRSNDNRIESKFKLIFSLSDKI